MFPAFLDLKSTRSTWKWPAASSPRSRSSRQIAERKDVAVGIIDVKSYYIETPDDVADRVRLCLKHAPAERLVFAPDCGLSQTARWAARQKLANMVAGVKQVREELGISRSPDATAAFQKDDAFLRTSTLRGPPGHLRLWWLGQSGFLLHGGRDACSSIRISRIR